MKTKFYENDKPLQDKMYQKFVHNLPLCLEYAIYLNASFEMKLLANAIDCFEFRYRHYVSGIHLTLHRVLVEIRNLKRQNAFSIGMAEEVIKEIEDDILETELYELMPRHLKAYHRIMQALK